MPLVAFYVVSWIFCGLWWCVLLNVHKWHETDGLEYPIFHVILWGWVVFTMYLFGVVLALICRTKREKTDNK